MNTDFHAMESRWEIAQEDAIAESNEQEPSVQYELLITNSGSDLDDVVLTEAISEQPSTMSDFKKLLLACRKADFTKIVVLAQKLEGNIEAYTNDCAARLGLA